MGPRLRAGSGPEVQRLRSGGGRIDRLYLIKVDSMDGKTTKCIVHYVFVCGGPTCQKDCKQFEAAPDGCKSSTSKNECQNPEAIAEAVIALETQIRRSQ